MYTRYNYEQSNAENCHACTKAHVCAKLINFWQQQSYTASSGEVFRYGALSVETIRLLTPVAHYDLINRCIFRAIEIERCFENKL